jgi:hypothetical protein
MLDKSKIKAERQLDINDKISKLDLQKRTNYTLKKDIRNETAKIDLFTKKIELFKKEIDYYV